jgi:hypothetical protein
MTARVTWTCSDCGSQTDGRGAIADDECRCSRCQTCHELVQNCECEDRYEDEDDYV